MAPKKRAAKGAEEEDVKPAKSPKVAKKEENGKEATSPSPTKTKKEETTTSTKADPKGIAEKLLSEEVKSIAFPSVPQGRGEVDWPAGQGKKTPPKKDAGKKDDKKKGKDGGDGKSRSYHSPDLSPFEQLVCAALLSKPISHTLGLRAIRTLLSPPFSLTTPAKMAEAGYEGRREALWEARTQHKEKTATQLGDLVDGIRAITGSDDEDKASKLTAVLDQVNKEKTHTEAVDKTREILSSNIKGIGPTGVDIFLRQVQRQPGWECVYPFIDQRGLSLASKIGLISESDSKDSEKAAKSISKLINDDKVKFVLLLDTLVALDLEKKIDEVMGSG